MSDQQPPADPPHWGPPPDPLTGPTRARSDSGGERPTAPAPAPAAPTALPGQPPAPPPPPGPPQPGPPQPAPPQPAPPQPAPPQAAPPQAAPPQTPAPQPGWAPPPGPHSQPPGAYGGFPPPQRHRRIWPFALGGGVLAVLLVGVLVAAIVFSGGGGGAASASGYYEVTYAAASEDAGLAWSQEAPDGLEVRNVEQLGDDAMIATFRTPYSSDDEEDAAESQAVAYDFDGDELWQVSDEDLTWASPSLTASMVIVDFEGRLAGLDPSDGEELWSFDADPGRVWELDDSLIVSSEDSDQTVVLDLDSGEELAEVDGQLIGSPSDESFVTLEDETVRHVDLTGEEQWSVTAEDLGVDPDEVEELPMASFGDGLVALSAKGEDEATLVALDRDSGEELWSETGPYRLQYRGVDGAVAAVRWDDTDDDSSTEPRPGELVLFDADGVRDAVEVEELSPWGTQGFMDVDGTGEFYASYESGTIIAADLEVVAEYDAEIADYTADGVYLMDDDELTLASWDSEDELFTIDLEHDGWANALDGAVAVIDDDSEEFGIYR